ncbi:MAG TPA: GNAT family N-acetyltransferase, partial [Bacillota bacterium]
MATRGVYLPPVPQHDPERGPLVLRDGTTAYLRPLSEHDRPLLERFLASISAEALYRRFFTTAPRSAEQLVRLLLTVGDPAERYALAALLGLPDAPEIIAVGNYVRLPGTEKAEVAFLVHDRHRGRGIGTLLLERLALVAVRYGICTFLAYTHADNRNMIRVFQDSGFPVQAVGEEGYVAISLTVTPGAESVARAEWRDRVATVASLRPFFQPRSVAVIGASRDPDSIGYRV